ncbi:uncharacterized protein [Prorops nasuta]|uniref:uncharacterized protein n=1 Tax=Prorops nasuta TaxID=863751 RepID=UPI0034CF6D33
MASTNSREVTLLDAKTNKMYTVLLSDEDANRAYTNETYAASLLKNAQDYAENLKNNYSLSLTTTEEEDIDDPSVDNSRIEEKNDGKNFHIWSREETLLLLELYERKIKDFSSNKITSKKTWMIISEELRKKGYTVTWDKCKIKFDALKRTYKSVTDHNKKSGNNRRTWEYYDNMHKIFSDKPWVKPITTASSIVSNEEAQNRTDKSLHKENIEPASKKRKVKDVVDNHMQKWLEQKKERVEAAERRHEEKMRLLSRIVDLLQPNNDGD